ncbi:unnamed protein product [Urochloa humidicola]
MEQILELDMEELQVEEVSDVGSSSSSDVDTFLRNTHGDRGINTSEDLMVDTSMVSLQVLTYLEAKVDSGRGKFAFLDGDKVLSLPMFYLKGVVLFPEASLPLRVIQPRLAEAIDKAVNHVDAPCMIGVVHAYQRANDGHHTIASVGTMAEIQEIRQLDDGSTCVFSRGQQRFRLIRHWLDIDGVSWGEVRIIEEDTPQRTPRDAFGQLAASNSFRQCASSMSSVFSVQWLDKHTITGDEDDLCFRSFLGVRKKDTEQQRCYYGAYNRKMASQAPLSFWPRWAYEMYDSYSLARRAADLWRQVIVNPSMDDHVRKPNHLSFYIGSNLPISGSLKQELLEIDGISHRLQQEIQLLKAFNIIRCRNCLTSVARRSDVVMLFSADAIGSHRFVKDMITVHTATGLGLRGDPSKVLSFSFCRYTWTVALCYACESNIGWLFIADKKNLNPKSFWAIRTSQVSDDTQSRQV